MDYFEKENTQIEKYLSDFTNREGVMVTVAGLLSLLPSIDSAGTQIYFLKWIFPFLLVAIATYICSSKRVNVISSMNANINSFQINSMLKIRYVNALRFH